MIKIKKLKQIEETEKRTDNILQNPKFINWFKGSKVVDSNGRPLVCFHGTKVTFNKFYPLSHFGTVGAASEFANEYSSYGSNIIPVYLSIKNPLRIKDFVNNSSSLGFDLWSINKISYEDLIKCYGNELKDEIEQVMNNEGISLKNIQRDPTCYVNVGYDLDSNALVNIISKQGYDGMYYRNEFEDQGSISWIILNSNQVWPIYKNDPDGDHND